MPMAVPDRWDHLNPPAGGATAPAVPPQSELHGSGSLSLHGGSPDAPPGGSFVAAATNVVGTGDGTGQYATAAGVPMVAPVVLVFGGPSTVNASTEDEGNSAFLTPVDSGPISHSPVAKKYTEMSQFRHSWLNQKRYPRF